MARRKPSITPALCISLIAHGLGLSGLAWWVVANTPPPKLAALDRVRVLLDATPKTDLTHLPPLPMPKPKPEMVPKKQEPPVKFEKPQPTAQDDSGEEKGIGTANRSTDGRQAMLANAGLEQADLMKPADKFVDDAFLPASKGEVKGNNAPPQKAAHQGSTAQEKVAERTETGVGALPVTPPKQDNPGEAKNPQPNLPVAQKSTPKPVRQEIRGHRATVSDTESVAFAREDTVTFHAGKMEGRKGLKVKTTTPHLGDAADWDLHVLGRLHLVLGITVDESGDVQNVIVLESSGSLNIDQDFKNEVWNHWNLEPKKDKDGHPIDMNWVVSIE